MLLLTFFVAVIVNFVGYIPLGNINLTAMQISINKGIKQAYVFALSFALVEGIFTFILMHFAEWFAAQKNLMIWLEWLMIAAFTTIKFSLLLRNSLNIPGVFPKFSTNFFSFRVLGTV